MGKQYVSKAIGIDLGTTNSVVTIMNSADTDIIIHRDPNTKRETTPSCVWKEPRSGQVFVGSKARSRIGSRPAPITSIKRSMGRQTKVLLTNEQVSPEQVSAYILSEMKRQIEEDVARLNTNVDEWLVDRAVITVPAYFDMPQIEATRKAGELAGLQVSELLHEPTAAACYHCWSTGTQNGLFLVYDFGGGTFDVSVLRCTEGAFEVLGISGDAWLGGDDIDTALAELLHKQLLAAGWDLELDIKNDEEDKLRFDILKVLMEGVKKALSTRDEFVLRDMVSLVDKAGNRVEIDSPFTRSEIEAVMRPIVERTLPYCFQAIEIAQQKAGVTLADVDAVILAGGSTHSSLVREMVRQALCAASTAQGSRAKCTEPFYEKVDTIVALGAAIRAAMVGSVAVYNPERTVRVSFNGSAATNRKYTHIGGQVESLVPTVDLKGAVVRLSIPVLDFDDEEELSESGMFGFKRIPLQPSSENLLTFEVFDKNSLVLAKINRAITQDQDVPNFTDGAGTAVLSKAILLEVNRAGSTHLKTLCEALTSLPVSTDFQFAHPGGTEQVRIALYQRKRKIYELSVTVPLTLPKGTPIDLNICIGKLAFISGKGSIGDIPFNFCIESPPDRGIPTPEQLEALEQDIHKAADALSPEQKREAEKQWQILKGDFERAVEHREEGQAEHIVENMEELITSISSSEIEPLHPSKEDFEELAQACFNLNEEAQRVASATGQPYNFAEIKRDIAFQQQQGEEAFAIGNQRDYTKAVEMLRFREQQAINLIRPYMVDTRTKAQKADDYIAFLEAEANKVMNAAHTRVDLQDQIQQIKNKLGTLKRDVQRNPASVIEQLRRLDLQLEKIKDMLTDSGSVRGSVDQLPVDLR
jgi:molecular chaperone DnaK